MASIEELKQQIKNGLAKPNRYLVNITFPTPAIFAQLNANSISDINANSQSLSILCETAELPGTAIATNEDKQFGPFRKMPYVNVFNDLILIFMCDRDMLPRQVFDAWQSMIVSHDNFKVGFYDDYISTIDISLLSEANETVYTIRCYEAYPIEVIAQQLSYGETDTYLKMEVRMAYRNWVKTF
jgi:hypothetical protein